MLTSTLLAALAATAAATNFSSYFANWAKYHLAPYSYDASDLAPLAPHLDELNYAFLYFCPPPGTNPLPYWAQPPYGSCDDSTAFQLMSVEPSDKDFLATITGYKAQNPRLSVLLSIGGWNFPSAYWSAMAATPATRATFIQSCLSWMSQTGADGVDVDCAYFFSGGWRWRGEEGPWRACPWSSALPTSPLPAFFASLELP
jgi:GH18 family chitinase